MKIESTEPGLFDPPSLTKRDALTGENKPSGDADLSGIVFRLTYYDATDASGMTDENKKASAEWTTNKNGRIVFTTARPSNGTGLWKAGSKNSLLTSSGRARFPLGVYKLEEIDSGETYVKPGNPWGWHVYRKNGVTTRDAFIGASWGSVTVGKAAEFTVEDPPVLIPLEIAKTDSETGKATVATFHVYNESSNAVVWSPTTGDGTTNGSWGDGSSFASSTTIQPQSLIGTFVTDADGTVRINGLPTGTYRVQEVSVGTTTEKASPEYKGAVGTGGVTATTATGETGATITLTGVKVGGKVSISVTDPPVRGDVSLRKFDPYGDEVDGASYSIYAVSESGGQALSTLVGPKGGTQTLVPSAYADYDKLSDPSQREAWIAAHQESLVCTISTQSRDGQRGVATTQWSALGAQALRRGSEAGQVYTYVVLETSPAPGFKRDEKWFQTFRISAAGKAIDVTSDWSDGEVSDFESGGDAPHDQYVGVQMPFTGGAGVAALVAGAAAAAVAAGAAKEVRDRKRDNGDGTDPDEG